MNMETKLKLIKEKINQNEKFRTSKNFKKRWMV